MRLLAILALSFLASCTPAKPVDSQYYRKCRRGCVGAGFPEARVIETKTGYVCECGYEPETPEKT